MPFDLPAVALEHFDDAPLVLAITQVKFLPLIAVDTAEGMAKFQQELRALDPALDLYEQGVLHMVTFHLAGGGVEQQSAASDEKVYKFRDAAECWNVEITRASLSLECHKYPDFDAFLGMWRLVLEAFERAFVPTPQVRHGVRYVNRMAHAAISSRDFESVLNPKLVSPLGEELGRDLKASMSEYRFQQVDDAEFVLRHGLASDDAYLLDFDHFRVATVPFAVDSIVDSTRGFHAEIEKLFAWCAEPYLRDRGIA